MSEHGTDVYVWGSTPNTIDIKVAYTRYVGDGEFVPINSKHVGKSFSGLSREEAFKTLRRLNRQGVRVPRKVFRRLRREIRTQA
ncbi:hypothetical protein [Aeromicrobium sp. 179-A 4D2 NHS]|uniref:hypothetical protein n=1 Tax=Aeromicrobium sp. 179-A 4D2 NHS TaxID=3142375 RepID=UPI00399FEF07